MDRPTILYGSPTNWNDVAGCLSRTHRRHARYHFDNDGDVSHNSTSIPLNPDVVWNWSRYSSSHSTSSSDRDASVTNLTEEGIVMIPHRRLLIAQYSGKGSYQKLLQEVEPINRAYAKRWGHDYTTLVGTALKFPGLKYGTKQSESTGRNDDDNSDGNNGFCLYHEKNNNANGTQDANSSSIQISASSSSYNYEAQSTFNKIPLLFKALDESPQKYDQVLILDSDTMIVDFGYDVTSLLLSSHSTDYSDEDLQRGSFEIKKNQHRNDRKSEKSNKNSHTNEAITESGEGPRNHQNDGRSINSDDDTRDDSSYFLVAYRVWKFDSPSTWDINAGITLWNLRHPITRLVAEDWLKSSLSDPEQVLLKNDDQYFLQRSLQKVADGCIFCSDSNSPTSMGVFKIKYFRNWWNRHSFLPALLNYYNHGTYEESKGPNFDGATTSERYSYQTSGGIGIRTVRDEFEYYNATLIKHFKRDTASWSRTGLEQRLLRIREARNEICLKWPKDCLW
eukprot:CAMPEP_0197193166 /NCGR_PEP_ID=MMETSP1423-20130617/26615_1 /TAXON_ID=476441 /ORGANISM="Pseudo-nitzschia heimii, Strain UNC1101" /LENGTH=505 /DNA_ID=CAMNT_0042646271 /DNA_START=303 /DNA_END=1820 /DNA_ORIENTATION=-